jgi:uncharacterized membrane protein
MSQAEPKKIRKSRTIWVAVATAAAGAALTVAPEAMPVAATGPGLILIAAINAALRVLTSQPVK